MTEGKIVVGGKEVRYVDEDDDRELVDRAEQIPSFADEADEQAWWRTHALSERFWREAAPVPVDKLPPVRAADHDARNNAQAPAPRSHAGLSDDPSR